MSQPTIAMICPLYNHFGYGEQACATFFKYTEQPCHAIVLDDASPNYTKQDWNAWFSRLPKDRVTFHHFPTNKGLTRSWNHGLKIARMLKAEYTVVTNSDILFTPGWADGLIYHLNNGYQLVGPVSNAPGMTNGGRQRVEHFYPGYQVNDDRDYLAQVSAGLKADHPIEKIVGKLNVNGFFMMAKTATWWAGAFDEKHVFNPGKRMTGNEDELQKRWKHLGYKTGFVPTSFIFHYRSVSRGKRYNHHGWTRLKDNNREI